MGLFEVILTGVLSTAGFTLPALLWMADRSKQSENRVDDIEKHIQKVQLEFEHYKELNAVRVSGSLDLISTELLDLKVEIKAIHRRLDRLKGFDEND